MVLRYAKLWHYLGACQIALVIYLMLTSITIQVDVFSFSDKLAHWFVFVVLMSWYMQLLSPWRKRSIGILLMITLGIGLEYLQGLNPDRYFEYADMAANLVGIASGIVLMMFTRLRYLYRIEAWLQKEKGE
jgi:hypothetical protein